MNRKFNPRDINKDTWVYSSRSNKSLEFIQWEKGTNNKVGKANHLKIKVKVLKKLLNELEERVGEQK